MFDIICIYGYLWFRFISAAVVVGVIIIVIILNIDWLILLVQLMWIITNDISIQFPQFVMLINDFVAAADVDDADDADDDEDDNDDLVWIWYVPPKRYPILIIV